MMKDYENILNAGNVARAIKNKYGEERLETLAKEWINGNNDEFFNVVGDECSDFILFVNAVAYRFIPLYE